MSVKKYIGAAFKITIAMVVIAFLGLRSLDFFYFITPPEQSYYAVFGFGLTGGGVIAYLVIFLWDAETHLKKAIAIGMLAFCIIGELLTAGFGLQINAWKAAGYQMDNKDFETMILAVQLLGFFHAAALVGYVAGDPIIRAFQDDDNDGIPNAFDSDYKPVQTPKPNKSSGFRFPWQKPAVIQNNAEVGKTPQIRMDNLTNEQLMELAKRAQDFSAMNAAKQSVPTNGNGATDPTQAAR
jgi:branched-subunit amino acid transport protein AzlD